MKNKEKVLLGLASFLGGVVVGFLISPIKEGISFGNNNGNNNGNNTGNYLGVNEEIEDTEEENSDL